MAPIWNEPSTLSDASVFNGLDGDFSLASPSAISRRSHGKGTFLRAWGRSERLKCDGPRAGGSGQRLIGAREFGTYSALGSARTDGLPSLRGIPDRAPRGQFLRTRDRPSGADLRLSCNETGFGERRVEQVLLVRTEELLGSPRLCDDETVVYGPTEMNHEPIRGAALIVQTSLDGTAEPVVVILGSRVDDDPDDDCHCRNLLRAPSRNAGSVSRYTMRASDPMTIDVDTDSSAPNGGPEAPRQTLSTGFLTRPTNREARSSRWSPPPDRSPPASATRWS